jgi:hypothetical protein
METIVNFLRIAVLLALSGAFIFLCIVMVRLILQKLLSPRLPHIYESLKPLFDPSYNYDFTHLEKSYWLAMSTAALAFLTFVLVAFFTDLFEVLWDLFRAI